MRDLALLGFSVLFYIWGSGPLVGLLAVSIVVDYLTAGVVDRGRRRQRLVLVRLGPVLSIGVNVGLLAYFKYSNFAVAEATQALSPEALVFALRDDLTPYRRPVDPAFPSVDGLGGAGRNVVSIIEPMADGATYVIVDGAADPITEPMAVSARAEIFDIPESGQPRPVDWTPATHFAPAYGLVVG